MFQKIVTYYDYFFFLWYKQRERDMGPSARFMALTVTSVCLLLSFMFVFEIVFYGWSENATFLVGFDRKLKYVVGFIMVLPFLAPNFIYFFYKGRWKKIISHFEGKFSESKIKRDRIVAVLIFIFLVALDFITISLLSSSSIFTGS